MTQATFQASIVGAAHVPAPSRRYYAWQSPEARGLFILYVEDVTIGARYSVQCDYDTFYAMREWSDSQWGQWLEMHLRDWLNR